jgi:arylsulfatase A-like enzyme
LTVQLRQLAATVVLGCATLACGRPHDVIVVTLDTTRRDHVGVYGYRRGITPRIDQFASEAIVYENAWSTASWTLPAHASILTGKHPTSHGAHFEARRGDAELAEVLGTARAGEVLVNRLSEDETTLPELLKTAGYATAAFAGGPWLAPPFGLLQGYDEQDVSDIAREGGRPAEELTDHALAWISRQPREKPVHVLINYFDPHWPYTPPPGYDDLPHAREEIDKRYFLGVNRGALGLTPEQHDIWVDHYDGEIRFMDHHLGRLLDGLRAADRYEDALIIVVADHGESFGEHGFIEHGRWLYDDVLRVPLIVRYPDARGGGSVVSAAVSVVDLLPLVATEVGLKLPADVEGVEPGQRDLVLAEEFRDLHAITVFGERFNRDLFAVIRWPNKIIISDRDPPELYDLAFDRGELLNIFKTRRGVAMDLLRQAITARTELHAPASLEAPRDVAPETRDRLRSLGYIK